MVADPNWSQVVDGKVKMAVPTDVKWRADSQGSGV